MTKDKKGAGECLPPMLQGVNETWPSEGILVHRLSKSFGKKKAAMVFEAHRRDFIGESDFVKMRLLGIQLVRVPITWAAFADALAPIDENAFGSHNGENDTVLVPDPFYTDSVAMVTIPRSLLRNLLAMAGRHQLKIVFDIHAMPGGSADGTFNGVWPNPPVFWSSSVNGASNMRLTEAGLRIANALIKWVENLDPVLQQAVGGLTLMNEPAHMSALSKFASESQILDWLAAGAELFRKSKLPDLGVQLYVNIIGTAFPGWQVPWDWWTQTFSQAERSSWAIIDVHWYGAWSDKCQGKVVASQGFTCDQPLSEIRKTVYDCIEKDMKPFADSVGSSLKATSEFSCGTFENALLGCNDQEVLRTFLDAQLEVFAKYDITPFFWTWRMPYGKIYERQWSLKMLTDMEDMPPVHPCSPGLGLVNP